MSDPAANLLAAADAALASAPNKWLTLTQVRLPTEYVHLVEEAAIARGLKPALYIRRAAVAFACYDLGIDLEAHRAFFDWCHDNSHLPGMTHHGIPGSEAHGPWSIEKANPV